MTRPMPFTITALALCALLGCESPPPCDPPPDGGFGQVTHDAEIDCSDIGGYPIAPGFVAIGYDVQSTGLEPVQSGRLAITFDWAPAGAAPSVTEYRDFTIDPLNGSRGSIRALAPDGVGLGPHTATCRLLSVVPADEQPCNNAFVVDVLVVDD